LLQKAPRPRRQQRGRKGNGGGRAHRGLAGGSLGVVVGWCRRVRAVQDERRRRSRRTGRRPGEAPVAAAASSSSLGSWSSSSCTAPPPPSLPLFGAATAEREKGRGWLGLRAATVGFLWGGPKVRERLRLGLFGVRARTRGGIAASELARLGLGLAARAVGVQGKRERAVRLRRLSQSGVAHGAGG
jgi:hypothetical protein